jgi:Zn-dependent peptidase ImmA (M78 family)/transcriptional regulator with XRE-family HTH domain
MINGERVKQVRELRGLTQTKLAKSIGVHQSEIAQIESGKITPSDAILERISFKTGFPIRFFKQPTSFEFPFGSLLYRARASIPAKTKNEAYQFAKTIFEVLYALQNHKNIVNRIPLNLPRLDEGPSNAAIQARSSFGLSPDSPIDNLVNVIEKNGVTVMALPITIDKMDAFSLWFGVNKQQPVIALTNNSSPGDRLRFSISHELAHLIMHHPMTGNIQDMENEANLFAEEFLMPKESMLKELTSPVTILGLMHMKSRWKVSIQALIRRAYRLQIISAIQYRYLMYQLSSRYGRKKEPIDINVEKPRLLGQLVEILYGTPVDFKLLASHMNLPLQLITETIKAHALKPLVPPKKPLQPSRPLRIVKKSND